VVEKPGWQVRDSVVDVFVDCGTKNRSAMSAKEIGEICTAPEETHP
jgi:hypothetical protein